MEEKAKNIKPKLMSLVKNAIVSFNGKFKRYKALGFDDLCPKENLDFKYFDALKFALKNKRVKNIAISGSYSSGKSSIIKSFFHKNKKYKCLYISVAYFKDGGTSTDTKQIEKNILKQMFYQIDYRKVPHSRYKRIRNIKTKDIILSTIPYIILLSAGTKIFKEDTFKNIKDKFMLFNDISKNNIYSIVIELLFILSFIMISINLLKHLKGKLKLNLIKVTKDVEVSYQENDNESIFNKEIDEILYFFEMGKYNIVIFEDIDRFNNIEIFVKLRELNDIINNSKQVNRRVTFIYAIKDDMFKYANERTKFFDFIIPVVPVINSSNSTELIRNKLKLNKLDDKIDEDLINKISVYIDDMRMVNNIYNEFVIYKENLIEDKDNNEQIVSLKGRISKLFGMIVYKNLYPEDFAKLQKNQGVVYNLFKHKESIKNSLLKELQIEYATIEENLRMINKDVIISIEELKNLYIYSFNLNMASQCYINGKYYTNDEFIEYIFNEEVNIEEDYRCYINSNYKSGKIKDILTANGQKDLYHNRKRNISLNNEEDKNYLTQKLENLKTKHMNIELMNIEELIKEYGVKKILNREILNRKALVYLLKEGFIDEDYNTYISYFYEGSLTCTDKEFIHSVIDEDALNYKYKLKNIENIINTFNIREFNRIEILNYNMLNFIITNSEKYNKQYNSILNVLTDDKNKDSLKFLDGFIDVCVDKEFFINTLCIKWKTLWNKIMLTDEFSSDKKDKYLELILKYSNVKDIVSLNKDNLLSKYISNKKDFLINITSKIEDKEKIKDVIQKLDVKFSDLDIYNVHKLDITSSKDDIYYDKQVSDFIYSKNLYAINNNMIGIMINLFRNRMMKCSLEGKHYTTIKQSECKELINYIEENINEYVENVFLHLLNNYEEEKYLLELLNNKAIKLENRKNIIRKMNMRLYDINSIESELLQTVVELDKFIIDWYNIIRCISHEHKVRDIIIKKLNNEAVYLELANKIDEDLEFDKDEIKLVFKDILMNSEISNTAISNILNNIKYLFDNYIEENYLQTLISNSLNDFNKDRIHLLINNKLINLTMDNYNALKLNFENEHINLISNNLEHYIEYIEEYQLSIDELELLFEVPSLTDLYKEKIINKISSEQLELFILNSDEDNAKSKLENLFILNISIENKVLVLNRVIDKLSNKEIENYLLMLEGDYQYLVKKGKSPILDKSDENIKLLNSIKGKFISTYNIEDSKIKINRKRSADLQLNC